MPRTPGTRRAPLVAAGATLCATALLGGTAGLAYAGDAGIGPDTAVTEDRAGAENRAVAEDNGIADMSASEISAKAREAVRGARSLHIRMSMDGATEPDDARSVDLAVDRDGNCAGTVGYAGSGGNFEIIKQGEDIWLKPDSAWWRANFGAEAAEDTAQFEGKHLQGSTADEELADVAEVCDLSEYVDAVDEGLGADSLKKGEEKTVSDTKAIELTGTDDGADVTVAVATDGKPYPVEVTRSGSEAEEATLDFDQPVPSNTPPAAQSERWPER
ncbi:hypothetical protein DY218_04590 [Streptomyces triticagri]|uniref:Lipoprotein n=1 Tax=Streptomyces triticagri TaxID=2293568 RepID=A0A372MC54_9ACTN|nr:hypothetical protein [Streptomyces triticagri]RFU87867.1 hypothetical protein DY218_04590 [Streptomyces triticagri]